MPAGFSLEIPYDQLLILAMGLFMFIGAYRGLQQEVVTSIGLGTLLVLLIEPRLAAPIVNYLAKFVRLIMAFVQGHGSVDLKSLMTAYEKIEVPFDGKNPYAFLIIALVIFVFLSYSRRSSSKDLTAMSRILGGLLGLLNGYLVISLFKGYVVEYIKRRTPTLASATAPGQVFVQVKSLPTSGPLALDNWQLAVVLLGVLVVVLLGTVLTGAPLRKKKEKKEGSG